MKLCRILGHRPSKAEGPYSIWDTIAKESYQAYRYTCSRCGGKTGWVKETDAKKAMRGVK